MRRRWHTSQGFTIVELIVIIVVIGILITISVFAYGAVQRDAVDRSIQSDLKAVAGLEARYALKNGGTPKPWYSGNSDTDINFTPSNGNIIDVVVAGDEYCIRGYNPRGNKNSVTNAVTEGSTKQSCLLADASSTAGGSSGKIVGWWKLNGNTVDSSGQSNHATVSANVTSAPGQSGLANGAYSFNGTNSQIAIPSQESLTPSAALTVSAWAKPNTATGLRGIVSKDIQSGIGNPPYAIHQNGTAVTIYTTNSANSSKTIANCGSSVLSSGIWSHMLTTFDGTTVRLYVDGSLCSTTALQTDLAVTTGALRIGQQKNGSGRWFSGDIDDVRVYNYALNATDVQQLYSLGAQ